MTKDSLLQSTGAELSRLAGEVLQPETLDHIKCATWTSEEKALCSKCNEWYEVGEYGNPKGLCTIPDPLPLTWPEAMKWRDWGASMFGVTAWGKAMKAVYNDKYHNESKPLETGFYDYDCWLECGIKPEHYIKAACLC